MTEGQVLFVRGGKSNFEGEDGDSTTAEEDIWDDTALVQAYDRAVSLAKEEVVRRMGLDKESISGNESNASNRPRRRKKKHNKEWPLQWQVGTPCRAVYSGDGSIYEATIDALFHNKGTCRVKYIGYGNEEEVPLKMLQPSLGQAARKLQEAAAAAQVLEEQLVQNGFEMECSDGESTKGSHFKPKFGAVPKSPQGSRMEWKSQTVRPPGPAFFPPQFRPLHMPPMGLPPMVVPPPPPPHLTGSFPEEDAEALSAMLMSWYMSGFHTGYYQGLKQAKKFSPTGGNFSRSSSRKK
ncbi:survival motor neuron protein [Zootermopsis nevadensis]|uniref:Survival motor neuron protein n=1 Tax=Zootermopsis nevadensis TaxID=136037 RepID=A0A067QIK5_ZOONE|nr:survival motor neuron protein [Zootermopsis nevadensis]XP_021941030.1 survival motor neuron protein [Zootermopsis nevadensis]KDR07072.1 Survival motor neuron protein [Zootermopsis nevadensis]